jgi:integrase
MLGLHKDSTSSVADSFVKSFTPHQLRHTFASNCYLAGIDVQTCMEWMGHSNIQTTLGIYTHLSKKHKKQITNKLDMFYEDNQLITTYSQIS